MKRVRQGSALLALVALFVCPAIAHGVGEPGFSCKRVHRGTAATNPNPKGEPPLVIGDSTVNLPIPNLAQAGFSVNARGCRGILEAINVAEKLRAKGRLPHLVLMNGYANGGIHQKQVDELLGVIGTRRVVGLVTEYNANTGKGAAPDTRELFAARRRYPRRIVVLDWINYSRPHHFADPAPDAWFLADLFHPNFAGAEAYAQFLARALPLAKEGKFPKRGG
jgi:hypothetical protein